MKRSIWAIRRNNTLPLNIGANGLEEMIWGEDMIALKKPTVEVTMKWQQLLRRHLCIDNQKKAS